MTDIVAKSIRDMQRAAFSNDDFAQVLGNFFNLEDIKDIAEKAKVVWFDNRYPGLEEKFVCSSSEPDDVIELLNADEPYSYTAVMLTDLLHDFEPINSFLDVEGSGLPSIELVDRVRNVLLDYPEFMDRLNNNYFVSFWNSSLHEFTLVLYYPIEYGDNLFDETYYSSPEE